MILKDGIIYEPIFSELAMFLVEKSRFKVYYVDVNSSGNTKILLTKDNVNKYCDLYADSEKRQVAEGALFLCLDTLPKMDISFSTKEGTQIKIEPTYPQYEWLNWL